MSRRGSPPRLLPLLSGFVGEERTRRCGKRGAAVISRTCRSPAAQRFSITAALLLAASAWGHTGGTTGFATVTLSGQTVRYSLALAMSSVTPELADRMRLGQPGFAPDYRPLLAAVEQHLHIAADGRPCEATPGDLTPPATEGANISIVLLFACASPPRELSIRDDLFDVLGQDYHTLANIEWQGGSQQFVFQPDLRETRICGPGRSVRKRRAQLLLAGDPAHSVRLRPSAVPPCAGAARGQPVVAAQDRHGLHHRPQHHPRPRRVQHPGPAGPPGAGHHCAVHLPTWPRRTCSCGGLFRTAGR